METLHNITDRLFVSLQQAREHPQGVSGLSTGIDVLNKLTTGWQKGELIVIAAPPRMGKTALALSMIWQWNLAKMCIKPMVDSRCTGSRMANRFCHFLRTVLSKVFTCSMSPKRLCRHKSN